MHALLEGSVDMLPEELCRRGRLAGIPIDRIDQGEQIDQSSLVLSQLLQDCHACKAQAGRLRMLNSKLDKSQSVNGSGAGAAH